MNIGYVRVSSVSQNTARQDNALEFCDIIYTDRMSGKDRFRPRLQAMLDSLQPGDVVYVEELSRLGRSMVDLYELAQEILGKGADIKSLKENIDLSSASGQFVFNILGAMAEFERQMIKERQAEGIAAAKAAGKTWGAKRKYERTPEIEAIFEKRARKEMSEKEALEVLAPMSRGTYQALYKDWKEENGVGDGRRFYAR